MATNIELNAKIDTANSAQSLGELKKSLKELISLQGQVGAGTEDFKKLQKAINDTEGKLGDLNDSFNTLKGSGVERLNGSLGLLKEGFLSVDPGKIGIAFKGLGAAMSAIPIFLLIEGLKYLYDNFEKITKLFGIGVRESDKVAASLERQKKSNEALYTVEENRIKIMQAEGRSVYDILKAQKELNNQKIQDAKNDIELQKLKIREILLNDDITESLQRKGAAIQRAMGNDKIADLIEAQIHANKLKRTVEISDAIRTDLITINNLQTESKVAEINAEKKHTEDLKKVHEDRIKNWADLEKQLSDARLGSAQADKENRKLINDDIAAEEKAKQDALIQAANDEYNMLVDQAAKKKALAEASLNAERFLADQRMGIANELVNGLASLGIKNKAVANAIFIVQKALAVAGVVIDTQKEIAGYYANPTWSLLPDGGISVKTAAATGAKIRAAIRIGTIAATTFAKFLGGGSANLGSTGGGGGGGQSISPGASIAPPVPQSTAFNPATVGQVGGVGAQKVVLVEHDVTRAQKKVKVIESQATFG